MGRRTFRRGPGGAGRAAAGLALLTSLLLAGCGAPEFHYVTNSADRTYVKIPTTWRQIDEAQLSAAVGLEGSEAEQAGVWLEGYDADADPSPAHLFGPHSPAPAAFISVQTLPEAVRGQFSLDRLRDLLHPVSPTGRQRIVEDPTTGFSDFSLLADEVLTPAGLHGVHVMYRYRIAGGPTQVFDKTAYLNDDASKLYLFLVRCSSQCYEQRQSEIESVVRSFTVRESR